LCVSGGTADITVHEISSDGILLELYPSTGGNWGGSKVYDAFFTLLSKLVGMDKDSYRDCQLSLTDTFALLHYTLKMFHNMLFRCHIGLHFILM